MDSVISFLKKLPLKFIGTNLFLISLLFTLFISSSVPIFTFGVLLDVLFILGFTSLIYFIVGNNLSKNIIFTIIGLLLTILFIIDHIYYTNFKRFSSITSLNNAGMVMDNLDAYGVKLDEVSIILIIIYILFVLFLFIFKGRNSTFKQRALYIIPSLLVVAPFLITYYISYNDVTKLDIIIFRGSYVFPEFIKNFGYLIYRYEDIAVVIDNIGG